VSLKKNTETPTRITNEKEEVMLEESPDYILKVGPRRFRRIEVTKKITARSGSCEN
jgi:hypothetical protein